MKKKKKNDYGYCECGCGCKTPISNQTRSKIGHYKGKPIRFIKGHNTRLRVEEKHPNWKGGITTSRNRFKVYEPTNKRAKSHKYVWRSVLIAEKCLGKPISKKHEIHHIDRNTKNDQNCNLVICEDHEYHMFLHKRQRAFDACGNAHWRKCTKCKKYDDPKSLYTTPKGEYSYHSECMNLYNQKLKTKKHDHKSTKAQKNKA